MVLWKPFHYFGYKFSINWQENAAAAKSLQSCPTLYNPIDGGPPGSPVPGILQARTMEWVAISFSNAWKGKVKVKSLSRVRLFETPWSAAYQALPSMGFSRQEYWSGVPLPSPGRRMLNDTKIFIIIRSLQFKGIQTARSTSPNEWEVERDQRNGTNRIFIRL